MFGWQIKKWEGPQDYWLATTGECRPGIDGALMRRKDFPFAGASAVNTLDVPSVDDFTRRVAAHGGRVAMSKVAIPGVGYFAYCQDTEGNTFGIMQDDPSAK